ncbi:free fatty acid receptor 4 [Phascolarctos cinereus]|uniref:Free fatty acid receptor 4 n=1 Tax=Phascolarctos cinereus TaxID=38626 RepID=A0A6P5IC75_PHACI|nr:free fatty acid receptor 4 isoform X2 [Phascolarctos cinereus]
MLGGGRRGDVRTASFLFPARFSLPDDCSPRRQTSRGRRATRGAMLLLLHSPTVSWAALGASSPLPQPRTVYSANRTFFPFFSEFTEDQRVALSIVETVALALIFVVSLVGNVCAILLLARQRRRGTTACLVLNLFCADLLFITAIPPVLAVRWTREWVLGDLTCHLVFYVMTLSGSVTILSLAAVSLERMVCIARMQHSAQGAGPRARAVLLAIIWIYAALSALPLGVFFTVRLQPLEGSDKEVQICTLVWPNIGGEICWDVLFAIFNFLIPGLVIVISYSKILQITKASRRRLNSNLAYSEDHHVRVSQQDYKLFRTLLVLMVSFFIMWSPIMITILLILIQTFQEDLVIWPSLFFWIVVFTFANSAVNPTLYGASHFQKKWWRVIFSCSSLPEKNGMATDTSVRRNDLSVVTG